MVKFYEFEIMKKNKSILASLKWITSVSQRFSRVDRKGRTAVTSTLATLGICFGVMTLIVVMSVMNGFQMSFIDAILEISSYHVRVENLEKEKEQEFLEYCSKNKSISYLTEFYEAQTLMTGYRGRESAAVIRAVNPDIFLEDEGFAREINIVSGFFDLSEPNSIVLGAGLAKSLKSYVGSTVNLLVLSGGNDVDLFSGDRNFKVAGIISSGYSEINDSFCFVNINQASEYFGKSAKKVWGIKLKNSSDDMHLVTMLSKNFENAQVSSWRDYNKTFFGALRIEKNMLLLLVALIFVVVAINIYNGMRRLVFERRSDIAIFSALGASNQEIKAIFVTRGLLTGVIGAFFGVILGLLISVNTEFVFNAAAKIMYYLQYAVTAVFDRANLQYVQENSSFSLYANIPARIFFREVFLISIFGIVSPLIASWAASKNVLKLTVAEVLHNE